MKQATIHIPDEDYAYLERKVAGGSISSIEDAVRELVREDRLRQAVDSLDGKIRESLSSGEPIVADRSYWSKLMALAAADEEPSGPPRS